MLFKSHPFKRVFLNDKPYTFCKKGLLELDDKKQKEEIKIMAGAVGVEAVKAKKAEKS